MIRIGNAVREKNLVTEKPVAREKKVVREELVTQNDFFPQNDFHALQTALRTEIHLAKNSVILHGIYIVNQIILHQINSPTEWFRVSKKL